MENRIYKPKEFVKTLNVTVSTLKRGDREETLRAIRGQKNRLFYTDRQFQEL